MHAMIRELADNDRHADPWGSCLMALGAICDVLAAEGETVPPETGYRPAYGLSREDIATENDWGEHDAARELLAGLYPEDFPGFWVEGFRPDLTVDDLRHAARVLHRYADLLRMFGRDY